MNIKAIALDIDGTLLDSTNQVHENLISILNELRQKGMKILLVTGRTRKEIKEVIPDNFPYDGAVTSNGMGGYIQEQGIFQNYVDSELVKRVIRLARKQHVYYEMHASNGTRQALIDDRKWMREELSGTPPNTLKMNEIRSRQLALNQGITWMKGLNVSDVVKIYFFSMKREGIKDWKHNLEELKQFEHFSTSSSSLHNVEIMKENTSKATGLMGLLEQLKLLPQELMAIGDGENDLSMFELCSIPVAMRNAPDHVKDKALFVTNEDYDHHGLYLFLKGFYRRRNRTRDSHFKK